MILPMNAPDPQARVISVFNLVAPGYDDPALRFFPFCADRLIARSGRYSKPSIWLKCIRWWVNRGYGSTWKCILRAVPSRRVVGARAESSEKPAVFVQSPVHQPALGFPWLVPGQSIPHQGLAKF